MKKCIFLLSLFLNIQINCNDTHQLINKLYTNEITPQESTLLKKLIRQKAITRYIEKGIIVPNNTYNNYNKEIIIDGEAFRIVIGLLSKKEPRNNFYRRPFYALYTKEEYRVISIIKKNCDNLFKIKYWEGPYWEFGLNLLKDDTL